MIYKGMSPCGGIAIGDRIVKEIYVGNKLVYRMNRIKGTTSDYDGDFDKYSLAILTSKRKMVYRQLYNSNTGPDKYEFDRLFDDSDSVMQWYIEDSYNSFEEDSSLNQDHTKLSYMFSRNEYLKTLDILKLHTEQVTTMLSMFEGCIQLTTINFVDFNTSSVTTMRDMFRDCYALASINLDGWDFSSVTNVANMFYNCGALTTILGTFTGIKINLDLKYSPLDNASAVRVISALSTVTSTRTLTLNGNTYNALTSAQKAVATSKGWTLASA